MLEYVEPSVTAGGGKSGGANQFPAAAYRYLTTLVQVAQGMPLGRRDQRELKTLATCLDCLARGNLAVLGDVLMQRFKAVESAVATKSWEVSQHFEVVDPGSASAATTKEREIAAKLTLRDSQLQQALRRPGG